MNLIKWCSFHQFCLCDAAVINIIVEIIRTCTQLSCPLLVCALMAQSGRLGCVNISACPLHKLEVYGTSKRHKLESLWYKQTAQNTLTQIFAKNFTHPSKTKSAHLKMLHVCARKSWQRFMTTISPGQKHCVRDLSVNVQTAIFSRSRGFWN